MDRRKETERAGEEFVPDFKKREVQNLYRKDELLPGWLEEIANSPHFSPV